MSYLAGLRKIAKTCKAKSDRKAEDLEALICDLFEIIQEKQEKYPNCSPLTLLDRVFDILTRGMAILRQMQVLMGLSPIASFRVLQK